METRLTRLQRAIVRLLAPPDERDGILADLDEEAAQITAAHGARAARRFVRWQLTHSLAAWLRRLARESAPRGLPSDIRVAARRLLQARAFSAVAVITLAIGIGAVSTVFSAAYAMWLKPLPYHEPDRLVWIHALHEPSRSTDAFMPADIAEHRRESAAFSAAAGFVNSSQIARVNGEPVRIAANLASPNLFRVLGVSPFLGRDFADTDTRSPVVMLSHAMWTRRFGQDRAVAGTTLTMDGVSYEIAGVMPRGFTFPRIMPADVWVPADFRRDGGPQRYIQMIARLAPGRSIEQAHAEAAARARHLARDFPATHGEWTTDVEPADVTASRSSRLAFQSLLGIVALFLLIACANLAGLLLARNAGRRTELAVCLSIGASRWRLARTLLIESAMLAAAGCLAGVLIAAYARGAVSALMPSTLPGIDDIAIDTRVIAVTTLTAMACAMLVGLLPVVSLRALRPFEALAGARGVARGTAFAQRALVVGEIALAVVMLVAASAMARSFSDVLNRDRGYNPRGLEALNVSLPFGDDSYRDREKRTAAFNAILERAASVPGVRSVAATTGFPGSRLGILTSARITPTPGGATVAAGVHAASAGYFETMGIPIRAGRSFTRADSVNAPLVAVVNEQLARQFPGGNPIGHRVPITIFGSAASFEIVGVTGDIHLAGRPGYRVFLPLTQRSTFWVDLVLRTDAGPAAAAAVRRALRGLDGELLLENESSLQAIILDSLALERAQSGFAMLVGALSAIVAGIGIYALMTFLVTQRRREFGIRLALGSQPRQLFQHAVSRALRLVAVGLLAGVLSSTLLVRALASQVFGLASANASAYLIAAALIVAVAAIAALIPARRAMKADPLVALRAE